MKKGALVYEGKAKRLYITDNADVLWVEYLDQATAFNGQKKEIVVGKSRMNNEISAWIFTQLSAYRIQHHFIEKISKTEQLVENVQMIPLEVVVRNRVAGSFAKRFGLAEGAMIPTPIVEFYYKNDDLDDPLVTDAHVQFLAIATATEIALFKELALAVNHALSEIFARKGIDLVDFKIEIGQTATGEFILADEISPDTCRLWDHETQEKLDKDVYRRELGDLMTTYQTVYDRLLTENE